MLQIGEGSRRALGEVLGLTNEAISLYSLAGRAGLDTDTLLYRTRTAVKHYSFPALSTISCLPSPVAMFSVTNNVIAIWVCRGLVRGIPVRGVPGPRPPALFA